MKTFFNFRQNNSGGQWDKPAVNVLVEASNKEEAMARTEPHFTICGDSGLYAEYDVCGCCPCCGHRWHAPWSDEPENQESLHYLFEDGEIRYMGAVKVALIKQDGSLVVGDGTGKLADIQSYVLS